MEKLYDLLKSYNNDPLLSDKKAQELILPVRTIADIEQSKIDRYEIIMNEFYKLEEHEKKLIKENEIKIAQEAKKLKKRQKEKEKLKSKLQKLKRAGGKIKVSHIPGLAIINCHGDKCRREIDSHSKKRGGIRCEACYGSDTSDSDLSEYYFSDFEEEIIKKPLICLNCNKKIDRRDESVGKDVFNPTCIDWWDGK